MPYLLYQPISPLTSSQHSGQSGGSSCGGNSGGGYSPWGPGSHQFNPPENFYNNPIPFPNGPTNQMQPHRYQITPPNQQPPPIPSYYPSSGGANRNIHSHYPSSHAHSDYQPFSHNHNRKCKNSR